MTNPSAIAPNLWLGGGLFPFPRTTVDLLITVCLPEECLFHPNAKNCLDLPLTNEELLEECNRPALTALAWDAQDALCDGETVIIRCAFGLERSALVAALVLCNAYEMTPREAVSHLRHYRSADVLDPENGDFLGWLEASL